MNRVVFSCGMFCYNGVLLPMGRILIPILGWFHPKIRQIWENNKNAFVNLEAQIKLVPPDVTRVWFHVASAGEFLQAKPVIEALKNRKGSNNVVIVLTYVSPSATKWIQNFSGADVKLPLPLDSRSNSGKLLSLIRPRALVFVKFDLWPNLIDLAHKRGISLFLISATLTSRSARSRNPLIRIFFGVLYGKIHHILAVSPTDVELFQLTNRGHRGLEVAGDTRADSVLQRQMEFSMNELTKSFASLRENFSYILVVGSSWPEDEKLLLPAWNSWCQRPLSSSSLLVLVPHEPTPEHLSSLKTQLSAQGSSFFLWSEITTQESRPETGSQPPPKSVLIFDQVGGLAQLYRIADVVYVGAGHGGVHNTMEPAAWALPIMFRDRYHNAPEAIAMVQQGVYQVVISAKDVFEFLKSNYENPEGRRATGLAARTFLEGSRGATDKCVSKILKCIEK